VWATRDSASPETSEDVRGRLALYKEWRSVVFFVSKRRCRKKRLRRILLARPGPARQLRLS